MLLPCVYLFTIRLCCLIMIFGFKLFSNLFLFIDTYPFHIVIIIFRSVMSDMTDFQEMLARGGVRDTFNSSLKDL